MYHLMTQGFPSGYDQRSARRPLPIIALTAIMRPVVARVALGSLARVDAVQGKEGIAMRKLLALSCLAVGVALGVFVVLGTGHVARGMPAPPPPAQNGDVN